MPPRRNETGKATDSMLTVDHLCVCLDSEFLSCPLSTQTHPTLTATYLHSYVATLPTTFARAWDISENKRVRTKSKF